MRKVTINKGINGIRIRAKDGHVFDGINHGVDLRLFFGQLKMSVFLPKSVGLIHAVFIEQNIGGLFVKGIILGLIDDKVFIGSGALSVKTWQLFGTFGKGKIGHHIV